MTLSQHISGPIFAEPKPRREYPVERWNILCVVEAITDTEIKISLNEHHATLPIELVGNILHGVGEIECPLVEDWAVVAFALEPFMDAQRHFKQIFLDNNVEPIWFWR